MTALRLFLVAGEHSGDALGARLMAAIEKHGGGRVQFSGVGGPLMEQAGFSSLFPMSEVAVMGPVAIALAIRRLAARVHETVDAAVAANPDVVVIIDSPEFTHRVATRIRKRRPDLSIVDYVSPSVWAWRPGRAKVMRAYVDHVLALLPFEPAAHRELGGPPCTYVGHPLIERLNEFRKIETAPLAARLRLSPHRPVLVVLPGSRRSEVGRLMNPFGGALELLLKQDRLPQVIIPVVSSTRAVVEQELRHWPLVPHMVEGEADRLRAFKLATAALTASGTVTLELGLTGTPMVVAYKVEPLAAPFLRRMITARSIVLPNLVLGENAFPEFIQERCTPELLAGAVGDLLRPGPVREAQRKGLARLPAALALPATSASDAAAEIVLRYAKKNADAAKAAPAQSSPGA
jgi:lipid-A-disaccharide synthase